MTDRTRFAGGGKPVAKVNLDALIPRENFEIERKGEEAPTKTEVQLSELVPNAFFYEALRKPDFQRETDDWSSDRVVDLIGTFLKGELIPAVVLWRNRDLYFVIDGAHRLSALIAWVHDDYGDKALSAKFADYDIDDEQLEVARETRVKVRKLYGTYVEHQLAATNPNSPVRPDDLKLSEEIKVRARRLGAALNMTLQWVKGESSSNADQAFKRINQRAAIISPQEFHLIETRKQPRTIAARAIRQRGTGRIYWPDKTSDIQRLASETYDLLFTPAISKHPSASLPVCGSPYESNILVTLHGFVSVCTSQLDSLEVDDTDGSMTVRCLEESKRVATLLCSRDASSVGLHPAIYFYSWTGQHQPILLNTITSIVCEIERGGRLEKFSKHRQVFEQFLMQNRALVNQVVRKFGSKDPEHGKLRGFYVGALDAIYAGAKGSQIAEVIRNNPVYSFLQPEETPYASASPRLSGKVKVGVAINEDLIRATPCAECQCAIPIQANSSDHKTRVADGGESSARNTGILHGYCNSAVKERRVARERRPSH